jgi:hypothetical protein
LCFSYILGKKKLALGVKVVIITTIETLNANP